MEAFNGNFRQDTLAETEKLDPSSDGNNFSSPKQY